VNDGLSNSIQFVQKCQFREVASLAVINVAAREAHLCDNLSMIFVYSN
jgi:hypothetical protein